MPRWSSDATFTAAIPKDIRSLFGRTLAELAKIPQLKRLALCGS